MQITGWTLDQIDAAPSETLDWLLRIDATVTEHRAEVENKKLEQIYGRR